MSNYTFRENCCKESHTLRGGRRRIFFSRQFWHCLTDLCGVRYKYSVCCDIEVFRDFRENWSRNYVYACTVKDVMTVKNAWTKSVSTPLANILLFLRPFCVFITGFS